MFSEGTVTTTGDNQVATNPPKDNSRKGAVKDRTQFQHPNGHWIKRNATTGRIMDVKSDNEKFKGVRKEK